MKIGFDNEAYIREQISSILERVEHYQEKLYLEYGGKIMFDYHAARVLPGFDPNVKMRLLKELKDKLDIILCVHAGDIERKKIRADFGISYDSDALRTIDLPSRFLGLWRPGVSINTTWYPLPDIMPRILSRVVSGVLETIQSFSSIRTLRSVDLPTLGLPTMATVPALSIGTLY